MICDLLFSEVARAPTGGAPTELFHSQWRAAGSLKLVVFALTTFTTKTPRHQESRRLELIEGGDEAGEHVFEHFGLLDEAQYKVMWGDVVKIAWVNEKMMVTQH